MLALIFALTLQASADSRLAEISYKNGSSTHTYQVKFKKKQFFLALKNNKRQVRVLPIRRNFATQLINEMNNITIKAGDRAPATNSSCSDYAVIAVGNEPATRICREHRSAALESLGLVKRLNHTIARR